MGRFDDVAKKSVMQIKPYVPGKPAAVVQRELGLKDVIKLASNENPLGPSKAAVKAMAKALNTLNIYPESGAYELRKALAKRLRVKPETLFFGNGSNELLQIIAEAFVSPGDEVMFSAVSFVVYSIAANIAGGTIIQIPQDNFRHNIDGFIARLSPKTKLIFICNPNNPTGTIISKAEFEKLMQAVPKNVIVVLDEAYFEYADDKNYPDGIKYLSKYPNLIVLRTFSKVYGLAGIRAGYGVADPEITGIMERIRPPFNINTLAQKGALAALGDKAHMTATLKTNKEGRAYLYAELKKLGIKYVPTQANFIFIILDKNARIYFEELQKKGVIIRTVFDNFARITIGTMKENKRLIKALKEIR
ncbi:MAG: histidinol-phosphate transaminase [Candidatus Goldbacteria bacterium]|nr:histidinol-phosphate transaminase [Candidatus Goldiibacteriota bacterium]